MSTERLGARNSIRIGGASSFYLEVDQPRMAIHWVVNPPFSHINIQSVDYISLNLYYTHMKYQYFTSIMIDVYIYTYKGGPLQVELCPIATRTLKLIAYLPCSLSLPFSV